MPRGVLHPMAWGTSVNSLALISKTINLFLPCKLIFWKSYHSWQPSEFSTAYISVVGDLSTTILYHISTRLVLDSYWKYFEIIYKKNAKVGSQNFGYHFFCTRLIMLRKIFINFSTTSKYHYCTVMEWVPSPCEKYGPMLFCKSLVRCTRYYNYQSTCIQSLIYVHTLFHYLIQHNPGIKCKISIQPMNEMLN